MSAGQSENTPLVVDASVVIKWFIPEEDSTAAARLLSGRYRLIAPDLIWAEFANVIWKYERKRLLKKDEATEILRQFIRSPIEIYRSDAILEHAMEIALNTQRTVYDCLYIALASREGCDMVAADQRLVNALHGSRLKSKIRLIGT